MAQGRLQHQGLIDASRQRSKAGAWRSAVLAGRLEVGDILPGSHVHFFASPPDTYLRCRGQGNVSVFSYIALFLLLDNKKHLNKSLFGRFPIWTTNISRPNQEASLHLPHRRTLSRLAPRIYLRNPSEMTPWTFLLNHNQIQGSAPPEYKYILCRNTPGGDFECLSILQTSVSPYFLTYISSGYWASFPPGNADITMPSVASKHLSASLHILTLNL
ncbi:hypothetical protein B0H12DRAFT_1078688 [Mycena haematopus]|nr:hypothetical protein B0H12DRAFT_1078688 [Mycena haematopus]